MIPYFRLQKYAWVILSFSNCKSVLWEDVVADTANEFGLGSSDSWERQLVSCSSRHYFRRA